jgi:hypothetical protein
VSSWAKRIPAAIAAPRKHTAATAAQKGRRYCGGRNSATTRQIDAPPRRISSGESAAQSIAGRSKLVIRTGTSGR